MANPRHSTGRLNVVTLPRVFSSINMGYILGSPYILGDDLSGETVEIDCRANVVVTYDALSALLSALYNRRNCARVYLYLGSPEVVGHFDTINGGYYKDGKNETDQRIQRRL